MKRRDSSRESLGAVERNPMRESTMYFLKQVFNNKNSGMNDDDDFYTTMRKTGGLSPKSVMDNENG